MNNHFYFVWNPFLQLSHFCGFCVVFNEVLIRINHIHCLLEIPLTNDFCIYGHENPLTNPFCIYGHAIPLTNPFHIFAVFFWLSLKYVLIQLHHIHCLHEIPLANPFHIFVNFFLVVTEVCVDPATPHSLFA